jgi:hypothetical protein
MNRSAFKFIALLTMTIDHIGAFTLLPYIEAHPDIQYLMTIYYVMRSIGRIAFVMFAFMIAEGFHKTRDVKKYFLRLFYYAVFIEVFIVIYYFISGVNGIMTFNVIWPLVFGLASLILLSQEKIWLKLLVIPIVGLATYLNTQYSFYGIMFIIVFGMYRNIYSQMLMAIGLNALYILLLYQSAVQNGSSNAWEIFLQWFSMLAFIFIFIYNGKKGKRESKWFFYAYYPAHVLVLIGLGMLIT